MIMRLWVQTKLGAISDLSDNLTEMRINTFLELFFIPVTKSLFVSQPLTCQQIPDAMVLEGGGGVLSHNTIGLRGVTSCEAMGLDFLWTNGQLSYFSLNNLGFF